MNAKKMLRMLRMGTVRRHEGMKACGHAGTDGVRAHGGVGGHEVHHVHVY